MEHKTIFLHIGTPKTGTTSIQQYLAVNELKLRGDGCLVPKTSRSKSFNHIALTNYALGEIKKSKKIRVLCETTTEKEISEFRDRFYIALREEIENFKGKYVVFSNEHCYARLKNEGELKRLKDLFEGLCDQLKIIVYIREQSDMLCSRYSTSLKNNSKKKIPSIEEYAQIASLDYNKNLKVWEDVFGKENIILRVFEKDKLHRSDVVIDFCETLGLPEYKFTPDFLNVSLNAKQCEFLRILNVNMPSLKSKQGFWIRKELNIMVEGTQIESPPVNVLINARYQSVYDESNKELAKRYFGRNHVLFNKRKLNSLSVDQESLLTEKDCRDLTVQIIKKNKHYFPALCKCVAAIFDVEYQGRKVPFSYVEQFDVDGYNKKLMNKISYYNAMLKKSNKRMHMGNKGK